MIDQISQLSKVHRGIKPTAIKAESKEVKMEATADDKIVVADSKSGRAEAKEDKAEEKRTVQSKGHK